MRSADCPTPTMIGVRGSTVKKTLSSPGECNQGKSGGLGAVALFARDAVQLACAVTRPDVAFDRRFEYRDFDAKSSLVSASIAPTVRGCGHRWLIAQNTTGVESVC